MKKRPNILIILADQYRYDAIGAVSPYMITPNLDRLAHEGCLFSSAYSNNPVCMPARHDLLTGLTGRRHGYFSNCKKPIRDYGLPTLPRIFSEHGYRTASIGKMHFFPARAHHGYSEMYTMEEIPKCREDDDYAMYLKECGEGEVQNIHGVRPLAYHEPQRALVKSEHYETRWVDETTIDWMDRNGENPFLLFVGYIKPHPPWDIPEEYEGIYEKREIPAPIPRSRTYPDSNDTCVWYGDLDTPEQVRRIQEAYYTSCTMVDESVGRILGYLEKSGKIDDTMVIFTSDHGEMLGDKGFYSKDLPYEGSVRVPLIIRYPQVFGSGKRREDFASLLDIFPTCMELAGLRYPQGETVLSGGSLADEGACGEREMITASNGFLGLKRWVMARTKEYKYIYHYNAGYEEFYDLAADPGETVNCIGQRKDSGIYRRLRQRALEYEKTEGPDGCVESEDFVSFPGESHTGTEHGKYHLWSNQQFQTFQNSDKPTYGQRFVHEIQTAMCHKKCPGVNQEWRAAFKKRFEELAEYENWEEALFESAQEGKKE